MGQFLDEIEYIPKGRFFDEDSSPEEQPITIEENGEELPFFSLTEEERSSMLAKGPIGIFEAWDRQNKADLLPYSPTELIRSGVVLNSVRKIQKNEYENPIDKEKDIKIFENYIRKMEEEQLRGFTWKGDVFRGAIAMPGFAIEILTSLGLVGLGKKVVMKGAGVATKKIVKETAKTLAKKSAKQLIKKAAKGVVSSAITATAAAPIMYNRYMAKSTENQIFANIALTDKGVNILKESTETPMQSFVKGYGDTLIEVFSELLGERVFGYLGIAAGKGIASKLSKATRDNVFKFMNKVTPKGKIVNIVKTLKSAGKLEGVPSEMLEEIVGDQLRAVFNVQDFGEKGGNTFDNMRDAIPSFDELSVMAGIFAVPGAMGVTGQTLYNKLKKRGATQAEAKNVIDNLSQSEQERVLANYMSKEREFARAAMDKAFKGQELNENEIYAMDEMFNEYVEKGWIQVKGKEEAAVVEKAKAIEAVDTLMEAEEIKLEESGKKITYEPIKIDKDVHPQIEKNINPIKKEIFEKTGLHMISTSMKRTEAEQQELFDEDPTSAVAPDKSGHVKGQSVDVAFMSGDTWKQHKWGVSRETIELKDGESFISPEHAKIIKEIFEKYNFDLHEEYSTKGHLHVDVKETQKDIDDQYIEYLEKTSKTGLKYTREIEVEETGGKIEIEKDIGKIYQENNKKKDAYEKFLDCISKL